MLDSGRQISENKKLKRKEREKRERKEKERERLTTRVTDPWDS